MPDKTLGKADAQRSAQAFDQDPVREATFDLLSQSCDDLAQQGILEPRQVFEPARCRSTLQQ